MVVRLVKGIWLGIKKDKSELKKVETKANVDEVVEEHDRLGCHLMLKGYSEEEVDAIKPDTYVEEEDEEEVEAVSIVDGLDGISHQMVLDNQGDDVELPEGGIEKALREMSLKIKDLETGLARERKTSTAMLSAQAKLQVELDSSRSCEDDVLMCNREFAEQFDRMKEVNENREDQYVKAHFRLVELTQAISDLTLQVEEKDAEIIKGLKELAKATERVEKLQSWVDALVMKGKQADMAQYRIQALEQSEERFQTDLQKWKIKAKESLVKRKEELLKDIPAKEELNFEIQKLRARVVDLEAMNLAESAKYIKNLEENTIYRAQVDAKMTKQKNLYAKLESRLEKVRMRFATMVIPDASCLDLIRSIVTYFVEEVERLESERDTLFKRLSDNGCISELT
ncbi:hypothetical protein GIB67_036433 [Kingdonia uniflora]|uniref:Uncharacterized protein n=1 Tax=Kingdonia uniflora TaxID=39325 RepID=A0A7J7L444_9MAGN|nr:hypothetical protein GIB67_036433 [Kingdonia uniflora]